MRMIFYETFTFTTPALTLILLNFPSPLCRRTSEYTRHEHDHIGGINQVEMAGGSEMASAQFRKVRE